MDSKKQRLNFEHLLKFRQRESVLLETEYMLSTDTQKESKYRKYRAFTLFP